MEDQLSVSGKVFKLINETGTTKADKAWEKQVVVIETEGQYPTKIAVSFMGEKVLPVAKSLKEGEFVKLYINVSSQSPDQTRWFNNILRARERATGGINNPNASDPAPNQPPNPSTNPNS